MILDARKSPEYRPLASRTKGVVFYSTPHNGSPLAAYTKNAPFLLYPSVEVKELSPDSDFLKEQHENFLKYAVLKNIKCLSFGEKQPTSIGLGVNLLIVPPDSANPNYGTFKELDVDHQNVCKPTHVNSPIYRLFYNFMVDLIPKDVMRELTGVLDPKKSTEEYCWGDMF